MTNPQKTTNGITLIALIITIIVMLILVTVAVRASINSGLFGHAKNAVGKWANAQKQEEEIDINDLINEYIDDDDVVEQEENENIFYIDDKKYTSTDGDFWELAIWNSGLTCLEEDGFSLWDFHYAYGELYCNGEKIYILNLDGEATLTLVSSNDDFVWGGRYYIKDSEKYNAICNKYNIIVE